MTKQELLVILLMISYTLMIVIGIHRYEDRIKNLNAEIKWLSKDRPSNAQHYTQIQLENHNLRNVTRDLDEANKLLQEQIRQLKVSLVEPPVQYKSKRRKGPLTEL